MPSYRVVYFPTSASVAVGGQFAIGRSFNEAKAKAITSFSSLEEASAELYGLVDGGKATGGHIDQYVPGIGWVVAD